MPAAPLPAAIPLITLDRIAVRQRDRWLLQGLSWRIHAGEQWAVVGANGAGKTTLAKAIAGLLPVVQGRIHYHVLDDIPPSQGIAFVASDTRRELWRRERRMDHARDFAGRFGDATTVRQLILRQVDGPLPPSEREARLDDVARRVRLRHLLDKPVMAVSTGEMGRVLIARQLIRRPRMLILDEPFEGLDSAGRRELIMLLDRLALDGLPLLLITHRPEELLPATTHVLRIDDGRVVAAGPLERSDAPPPATPAAAPAVDRRVPTATSRSRAETRDAEVLVDMRHVTVRYGGTVVLDRLTWTVRDGDHWAVSGANGAGKSTLLKLITGDCLQVHANRIRLFGRERGPEQSLGEIRERLGVVSHDLATGYQKRTTALDVVCSGFFDSVGLYRFCDAGQAAAARAWLARLGIADLAATPFNHLSQGQRQLILIARAMVKSPRLLILDEPCAGLDPRNRTTVLDLVERIGRPGTTGLIYVTHHERELPACTTHRLVLDAGRMVRCGRVGGDEG